MYRNVGCVEELNVKGVTVLWLTIPYKPTRFCGSEMEKVLANLEETDKALYR